MSQIFRSRIWPDPTRPESKGKIIQMDLNPKIMTRAHPYAPNNFVFVTLFSSASRAHSASSSADCSSSFSFSNRLRILSICNFF